LVRLSAVVSADITQLSNRIYFVFWFFHSASVARLTIIKYQHSSKPSTLHVTSDKTLLLQIFAQRQLASAYIFNQQKQSFIVLNFVQLQSRNHTTVDKSFIG